MLAGDLFTAAHDEITGRPRLHRRVIDVALAGALLADLVLDWRINIYHRLVYVANRVPPADPLLAKIHARVVEEPERLPVRTWLAFLATYAYEEVGQRLVDGGAATATTQRRLLRARTTVYVPRDWSAAAWPAIRLVRQLTDRRPLTDADLFLAGTADAAGLLGFLLRDVDDPAAARAHLHQLTDTGWEPVRELLGHTQAAIANTLVTHRT